ncbi:MAG: nucleotidyltransferase family protein [Clostridiales bacterium]|nr:nucleotidyltransferase family protein [Clostridiales bacterium]
MARINTNKSENLIKILRAVITEESCEQFIDLVDEELLALAEKHHVTNTVCCGFEKYIDRFPEALANKIADALRFAVYKDTVQQMEGQSISDEFEKNSIKHMILKGSILKDYYPVSYMRSMADLDYVVGKGEREKIKSIMESLGYYLHEDALLHDSYFKRPVMNVEIHEHLIDECYEELNAYFGSGFERAVLDDGFEYRYKFKDEDYFVYIVTHMAKHYYSDGTGIRSIMDTWICLDHFVGSMDFDYCLNELKKIRLLDFYHQAVSLAFKWFGKIDGVPYEEKDVDFVEKYVISNGVYGSGSNSEALDFIRDYNDNSGKLKYYSKVIFPGFSYMSQRYSILKKAPFLLPAFWIVRFFQTISHNKNNIGIRLDGVSDMDEEKFNHFKAEFEKNDVFRIKKDE